MYELKRAVNLQCGRRVQVVPEVLGHRDHPGKVTDWHLELSRATLNMIHILLLWACVQIMDVLSNFNPNGHNGKQKILTSCPGLPDGPGGPEGPASPWEDERSDEEVIEEAWVECVKTTRQHSNKTQTGVMTLFIISSLIKWLTLTHKQQTATVNRQTDRDSVMVKQWAVGWPSVQGSQRGQFSLWIPEEWHQRAWDWYSVKIHKVEAANERADVSLKSPTPALGQNTNWDTESGRERKKESVNITIWAVSIHTTES